MASELSIYYGGKRYLSGYITFNTAEKWAQHFGDRWPMILDAKKKFDPDGIMAPGFIRVRVGPVRVAGNKKGGPWKGRPGAS